MDGSHDVTSSGRSRTARGAVGALAGIVALGTVAGMLISAALAPAVALTGMASSTALTLFEGLPSILKIDELMLPTTFWVKDPTTGEQQVLTQFYDQNRSQVDFDQIAPVMYDAILSSEDPRYYQHGGVDLIGTARAVVSNVRGGSETQGGSSISQQYVKNILVQDCERYAQSPEVESEALTGVTPEEALGNCWTEATTGDGAEGIERKLQEMRYAIALEKRYSKNEILLGYLNIANFGGTTYGIDAAARYYFGVSAAELSLSRAATLAGIVQNPNSYRIDRPTGSIVGGADVTFNKAPDGDIDDIEPGQLSALDDLLSQGRITQEQYSTAADGYSVTKGRQLYVLSRMLSDGKISMEQYEAAVVEPITPNITTPKTGCAQAAGAEYFCQYARTVVENDPAFGETPAARRTNLRQGGLDIYLTLDWRVQNPARDTFSAWAPSSLPNMAFGAAATSVEGATGRVLSIAQNTHFTDGDPAGDPNYTSIVYAGDLRFGGSNGFPAGSTFKLFTLVDWLEQGKSLFKVVDGIVRPPERMTNTCSGDWVNTENWKPNNSGGVGGYVGTPMQFTRDSLNSGYVAMGADLDLCDIAKVAKKMGVTYGDGSDIPMAVANDIIGSANVSPLAMAAAFATVANGGVYCQPTVIDRVIDSHGDEIPKPERSCSQVLDPAVAATAATALQGVMNGGSGDAAHPRDGVPVLGKTGTHEYWQTWMAEASSEVATVVWVGNSTGEVRLDSTYTDRDSVNNLRFPIAREIQTAVNSVYGGDSFPQADARLTQRVLENLPNVVGMSVDEARTVLEGAGFGVEVSDPVDSERAEGTVATQSPGAGRVAGGTVITLGPSNAQAVKIPDVSGRSMTDATSTLREAGFVSITEGRCNVDSAMPEPRARATDPASGVIANRNAPVVIEYAAAECGGQG